MPLRLSRRERYEDDPSDGHSLRLTAAPSRGGDALCAALAEELPHATSGVAFVYEALAHVVDRLGVQDAVLVVDDVATGRQVFRHRRAPLEHEWSEAVLHRAPPGLHTRPEGVDEAACAGIAGLCAAALRYDLVHHDASHDALTGLLNRRAFDEVLGASAGQASRYGWSFTLALLDLDGFKGVNDRLGHHAGDACLRAVGVELRRALRNGDVAARVGGDEFGLVFANADGAAAVDHVRNRLRVALREAVPESKLDVAAGIATAPVESTDPVALYRLADKRLYDAKKGTA